LEEVEVKEYEKRKRRVVEKRRQAEEKANQV